MIRNVLGIAFAVALAAGPVLAGDAAYVSTTVTFQCPGEQPQSFRYASGHRTPMMSDATMEAQWYWNRTRTDRGQGCQILRVE